MSPGHLFAVAGPSGAGKDTLMAAARRRRPDLVIVRRVITRPSGATGEPHEGVSEAEFARRRAAGDFALWWEAHGLRYGIPATIRDDLGAGRTVLFNASRRILATAGRQFPGLVVLHVTAPDALRAERLAARGRESAAEIGARLDRSDLTMPDGVPVRRIVNDGGVEDGAERLLAALQPARA
ncbi:ribose 1,5-bisphosphokinase [Tranquillimonas rosea]|uniref:Ribose 1,5-bisphosphate phosphokinase PhnN n=1 Tax=Tranquillimonas rosea TaxID=641238 RepID=A0A1H9WQT0_9RHOB|nr:phosphonate metabolism protein/1,5-bisphosphokinase (PRPP-forming) PhnN [Tranquillimonas rosea]SES36235.1 ribose 1,5-bisphosphokinase [Tranquillimonas rosea]